MIIAPTWFAFNYIVRPYIKLKIGNLEMLGVWK